MTPQPLKRAPGGGRKPSGNARAKLQITLPPAVVANMDRARKKVSRSEWIEKRLDGKPD